MDENAQDERIEIGEPPGMIEGGYVVQGFDPTRAGELVKATDKRTRRWFLHKTAVIGGGAFAVGLAVKLGLNEHEAIAVTCSCGVYYTGQWSCEHNSRGGRTGRVSFFYQGRFNTGTARYCGATCGYWGPWHCDTNACPSGFCPNY
jgi:hypothetical protein